MSRVYSQKKQDYAEKLSDLLQENTGILVAHADHVGSNQLQLIRQSLRGRGEVLMGKNTQMRRVIRQLGADMPDLLKLLPHIIGNVGLIFTNENVKEIRDLVVNNKVPAAARVGVLAPVDVIVPPGPTGMDPGQTAFFQSMGIPTKIMRGSIEIISNVHLIRKGEKVGSSEVALLSKLGIKPFSYGLVMRQIYDMGSVYAPEILDISEGDLVAKFFNGLNKIAAVSLEIGYPTIASVPHSLAGAFKKLVAIAVETEYTFPQAQKFKDFLANPDAFKVAAPAAGDAAEAVVEEQDEESESDEEIGGGGLFGDDSDSDSDSD